MVGSLLPDVIRSVMQHLPQTNRQGRHGFVSRVGRDRHCPAVALQFNRMGCKERFQPEPTHQAKMCHRPAAVASRLPA